MSRGSALGAMEAEMLPVVGLPSVVPAAMSRYTQKMNFLQRVDNLIRKVPLGHMKADTLNPEMFKHF